jgi:hypothetical protein
VQRCQCAREIRYVAFQERNIDVFPANLEIESFSRFGKIREEQAFCFIISPIAVRELVPDIQAVQHPCECVSVVIPEPGCAVNRLHQSICSFQPASRRADAVEGAEDRIAEVCGFTGAREIERPQGHRREAARRSVRAARQVVQDQEPRLLAEGGER